jgi:hypothetical protein
MAMGQFCPRYVHVASLISQDVFFATVNIMTNLSFCSMDKTWIDLSDKADYPKVANWRKGTSSPY